MLQEAESGSEIHVNVDSEYINYSNWAEGQVLPVKLHVLVEYVRTLTEKENCLLYTLY